MSDDKLLPCPFCGAGTNEIRENGRIWQGMAYSEPASVSVRHWCVENPGQPSRVIERVGRDRASAIAAWNTRAALAADPGPADEPVAMTFDVLAYRDMLAAPKAEPYRHAMVLEKFVGADPDGRAALDALYALAAAPQSTEESKP